MLKTQDYPSLKLVDYEGNFSGFCHDPMLKNFDSDEIIFKERSKIENFDLIVLAVSHQEYKDQFTVEKFNGLLVDSNNVLSKEQIAKLINLKFNLKIIGRGDI